MGLVTYIELVAFLAPVIIPLEDGRSEVNAGLENAITLEIDELIRESTKVGIAFDLTIYTEDNLIYRYREENFLRYHSLNDEYKFSNSTYTGDFREFDSAVNELTVFRHIIDIDNPRVMIIEAELLIPGIRNKELVESLWQNSSPRITYNFKEGK